MNLQIVVRLSSRVYEVELVQSFQIIMMDDSIRIHFSILYLT